LDLSVPALNDLGQVAYFALLKGTGVGNNNNAAIYAGDLDNLKIVARERDPAPGTAKGVEYSNFVSPTLNDVGQVAYFALLIGGDVIDSNNTAIYAGSFASPQLVAREGSAAPGTPAGVNYSDIGTPALNDAGQVAYYSALTGSGVTDANNSALFAFDPTLGSVLIAREGDLFAVAAGDLRTVANSGMRFLGGRGDDTVTGLSSDGTLAFRLSFTDGTSGIFTALVRLPGDATGDRAINFADLVVLAQNYNLSGTYRTGDFSGDGTVNFADLVILAQNYSTSGQVDLPGDLQADWTLATAMVPEPISGLWLMGGIWTSVMRRRRA
jgi:hypothetical protein